jgi:hypothetical protein
VDARTASLVLNGPRSDVERALALLEDLDRRLRTLVIEHGFEELEALEAAAGAVDWSVSSGPLRVGTLPAAGGRLRGRAERLETSREHRSLVRVLEGTPALLLSGRERVVPEAFGASQRAESGFEALATLLASERVQVELRPFDGRFEDGVLRYTSAATVLELTPGETAVVARVSEASRGEELELPRGVSSWRSQGSRVLLLRVDVER